MSRLKQLVRDVIEHPVDLARSWYYSFTTFHSYLLGLERNRPVRINPRLATVLHGHQRKINPSPVRLVEIDATKCTGCRACEMVCALHHSGVCAQSESRVRVSRHSPPNFAPFVCRHCGFPACEGVCPTGATRVTDVGLVTVDPDVCIGCKLCVLTCPGAAAMWSVRTKTTTRCDLCGGDPMCVKVCSTGALTY